MRLAIFICILSAWPALAQQVAFGGMQQDPSAPVEVSAEQLSVNQSDGSAVFTGNVIVGQGEMRLSAATVRVIYAEEGNAIERMQARGGVTLVNGTEAAEAAEADYSIDSGVIVMRGNVLVTQGQSAISADQMTVDLKTGLAQMEGRVRTILQTGEN
ncbi:LptA/OstA family protein [Pseudaestuariivita rosea]|uniref:LptA/OstA family protein n=1 Tax=Pseudaestuariivita rosea TaxID=2763263 RepID=UPI001F4342BF|nr:LptA/OstA family protein [Pseudaestuariivita rosea]